MTVGQLRARLAGYHDDLPIVMSKDAEGNGYSPLEDVEATLYVAHTTWSGECYPDWYAPDNAVDAVCLWPGN